MSHSIQHIEKNLMTIQGYNVLIDRDVAQLYGVETKEVNQAIKNNPISSHKAIFWNSLIEKKANWSKILTTSKV